MKQNKADYCTLVFYLLNGETHIDTAGEIVFFDDETITVASRYLKINKEIIKSVTLSTIECANMHLNINAKVTDVSMNGSEVIYVLKTPLKKEIQIMDKRAVVLCPSVIKKMNIKKGRRKEKEKLC